MLQFTSLRTLAAVVETGSFANAGRQLGYTPSAVSQQIASLERSTGIQLFERSARSISPTQAAVYLYEQSRPLLNGLRDLDDETSRLAAGQAGRLRVGSFATAGGKLLPETIARFLATRPDVRIALSEGEPHDLVPRVTAGELDVALSFAYDDVPVEWPEEIRVTALFTDPLVVIAARNHPLAVGDPVSMGDLRNERWVTNTEDTAAHTSLTMTAAVAGFEPTIAFRSGNYDAIRGLVRSALGISMIPTLAYIPERDLDVIAICEDLPRRHVQAVSRGLDDNPLVHSFIAALHQVSGSIAASPAGS